MEPILKNGFDNMPRTDYPRPMWARNEWYCLNGEWDFEIDYSISGEARSLYTDGEFTKKITVPFCPESKLSGIEHVDFMPCVWYRKKVNISCPENKRTILHFGAVDNDTKVWINGKFCGSHYGGYTPFEFDVTDLLNDGENTIVVMAKDDNRSYKQLHGKQSTQLYSHHCSYTRTTGIWQTVWFDFVPETYLLSSKMTPHAKKGTLDISLTGSHVAMDNYVAKATAYYNGKEVGNASSEFMGNTSRICLKVDEIHLWDVLAPELYDLKIELFTESGELVDTVSSYFALRDISYNKKGLTVNGKPVFMRLILDQGFNPDGIYTGPTAKFLEEDIDLSIKLGFNGARLHQRIFEERTLYYADKKGYMVWAEAQSGFSLDSPWATERFLEEWMEILNIHYNHPAVIGWCPHNETYHFPEIHNPTHVMVYDITKMFDPYRPCIDASGGVHYKTDMFDVHDYEQKSEILAQSLAPMLEDPNCYHNPIPKYRKNYPQHPENYCGQAYWVSEYGGTFWNPAVVEKGATKAWGYGSAPQTEEEFLARYEGLTNVLLSHPRVCGFCYTQLTDIQQEQNGLVFYDRTPKFSEETYKRIREINQRRAAIEEE